MKAHPLALTLALTLSATAFPQSNPANPQASPIQNTRANPALAENYGKLPLSFEANQGQSDPQVKFLSKGNGYTLFLTNQSAVLALTKTDKGLSHDRNKSGCPILTDRTSTGKPCESKVGKGGIPQNSTPSTTKTDIVRMELTGSNPTTQVEGNQPLPGTANYFLGNDPSKWHTNVPTYAKVSYKNVYPGVDLLYYVNQRQLEYDFIVQPKANPKQIKLHFAGAQKLTLDQNGDLEVVATNGQIAFHKPVIYQIKKGQRQPIEGTFTLLAKNDVGFKLGTYDKSQELVIDPTLAYSTYLGGSGGDGANGIAVDDLGYTYVTGYTYSSDFPVTKGALQVANKQVANKSYTAFVTKINPTGSALVYSTFLGGSVVLPSAPSFALIASDSGSKVAVDASGDAYVVGSTNSADFPVTKGAFQTVDKDPVGTVFVTKLNATGTGLVYSTFLSGSSSSSESHGDIGNAIAVDASGDAYVTGSTGSPDFPVTKGAFQTENKGLTEGWQAFNAFVAKLNAAGSGLEYSTYLGGGGDCCGGDSGNGIAINASEEAYIVGSTNSSDFPATPGAFQTTNNVASGDTSTVFVTRLNASGSALIYSTFVGGTGIETSSGLEAEEGAGIAVDTAGSAYITGSTFSPDFPVTPDAFQTSNDGSGGGLCCSNLAPNAFVTKLNPSGSALIYSTYLGGTGLHAIGGDYPGDGDAGSSIGLDASGEVYVTGLAYSRDFPVTSGGLQTTKSTLSSQAFLSKLNAAGSSLLYSTYLGGSNSNSSYGDSASGIALDPYRNAYLAGTACSSDFPVTAGAFQTTNRAFSNDACNAFLTKFIFNTTTTTLTSTANPSPVGEAVTFTATVTEASGITPTGTVAFTIDGGTPIKITLDDTGHAAYSTSTLAIGVHALKATYSGSTNYSGSSGTFNETIVTPPSTLTIATGSGQASTYGTAYKTLLTVLVKDSKGNPDPGIVVTFTGTGLKFSSPTAVTGSNGEASVNATPTAVGSLKAAATAEFLKSTVTFDLTSTKAVLTVTANNLNVPYDKAIPALTDTITGFVNGDTSEVVTGKPTLTTTGKQGSPVGTYPITVTQGTLAATNYTFKLVNGTLTITPLGTTATPTFTPAAGTYSGTQKVTLADKTTGATIYFTLNGATPTTSSTKYTSPISVGATKTIKAIAVTPGYTNSAIATASYTIK